LCFGPPIGTVSAMSRALLLTLYLAVVSFWGTTWIAIKTAVATVPPITASGLRFAIAFPVLALIVARLPGARLRYPPGHRRLFALVTAAYFVVPFALMNLGSAAVPSGLAAVLFATVAIFIMVFSVPLLGTRITARQATGIGVALVALAALIANQVGLGGEAHPLGVLALLAAAMLHALVYVLLKRDAGALSPFTLNALPMGVAGVILCGAGWALERPDPTAFGAGSLTALLYLGAVASVIGFLAYFQLLRHLRPVPLSLVFVLFPLVAQLSAVLAGERPMGPGSLALLVLVLLASLVALTGRQPSTTTTTLPESSPAAARACTAASSVSGTRSAMSTRRWPWSTSAASSAS
jgi:drug/metabolite transporter (DMT)-like permease